MDKTITIEPRFCGPPDSGNGGYVCGILANHVDYLPEVMLRKPPPLRKPLTLKIEHSKISLNDGDVVIAEANPGHLHLDAPQPPDFELASKSTRNFIGFTGHVFPTCFVCGPQRHQNDGLRIFAGRVDYGDLVAAPWIPDVSLVDEQGKVRSEFHWAALDCPGYFAITDAPRKSVLGKMTAKLIKRVGGGEKCVVVGWPIRHDGRKHFSGTAIYAEDGSLSAIAHAVWIDI